MKATAIILLVSLAVVSWASADDLMDSKLAEKAEVVLRVKRLSPAEGSKYLWYEVEILKVLKNASAETFDKKLKIAAYSWKRAFQQASPPCIWSDTTKQTEDFGSLSVARHLLESLTTRSQQKPNHPLQRTGLRPVAELSR